MGHRLGLGLSSLSLYDFSNLWDVEHTHTLIRLSVSNLVCLIEMIVEAQW